MEIIPKLFYPLLATAILIVLSAVVIFFVSKFAKKYAKITTAICGILVAGGFIAVLVFMGLYYDEDVVTSGWYPSTNTVGMGVSLAILLVILAVIYVVAGKKDVNNTRAIVYGAISIAMSFALSFIRIFKLPQGGTVTFASLLPLMVYSAMFGSRRGIIVCIIYGTLQAIQDPFIIHPVQFLLDYSVAYAFIGASGILIEKKVFKSKTILNFIFGGVGAILLRYASHVLSGIFAFADYIGDGYTVAAWSFAYNSFALVDMAISIVAGCFLFANKQFLSLLNATAIKGTNSNATTDFADDEDDETAVDETTSKSEEILQNQDDVIAPNDTENDDETSAE